MDRKEMLLVPQVKRGLGINYIKNSENQFLKKPATHYINGKVLNRSIEKTTVIAIHWGRLKVRQILSNVSKVLEDRQKWVWHGYLHRPMQTFWNTIWIYVMNLNMSASHKTQRSHSRVCMMEGNSHPGPPGDEKLLTAACVMGVGGKADSSWVNRWVKRAECIPWSGRKFSRKQTQILRWS